MHHNNQVASGELVRHIVLYTCSKKWLSKAWLRDCDAEVQRWTGEEEEAAPLTSHTYCQIPGVEAAQ